MLAYCKAESVLALSTQVFRQGLDIENMKKKGESESVGATKSASFSSCFSFCQCHCVNVMISEKQVKYNHQARMLIPKFSNPKSMPCFLVLYQRKG